MAMESCFIGTELKFVLEITASGFNMANDDFEVDLTGGGGSLHFNKSDVVRDDNDTFYVCFDSKSLGVGRVLATITAHVPDADFEDGVRDEITKINLITIRS